MWDYTDLCVLIYGYGCRTGDSRGFAFVRYKYEDEAQKAVDRLDGEFSLRFSPLWKSVCSMCGFRLHGCFTCCAFYFICRESGRREGDHGAVCQVRPKC